MTSKHFLICLLLWSAYQPARAQGSAPRFFVGSSLNLGVGKYNGLGIGGSAFGRVELPLGDLPNLTLTGKIGIEVYRVSYSSYVPSTYLGYGYNAITGYGFNTIYSGPGTSYFYKMTGLSLPLNFGPRLYLPSVLKGAYAGLNVGVDIGINEAMGTAMHVEPAIGWLMPLANGHSLDLNTAFFTSFSRGSGVFAFGAAYSLR